MTDRSSESKHTFTKGKSHRRDDFESHFKKKKQYRDGHDPSHYGSFKRHRNEERNVFSNKRKNFHSRNYFTQVPKPEKPRKYTVSIAVPASILDATSVKDELRTYVVGQIARAAVIYSIDEIIVYDDGCWTKNDSAEQQKHNQMALDKMKMLLEYQELPQYLRKYFFGFDKHLRCVGLLNPLNSSHHLKFNEWCEYREGVVLEESESISSYVDVGLRKNILIDQKLEPGLRVTVKLPAVAQDMDDPCGSSYGTVVSPDEPRVKCGYYWGYSVRVAQSLSEVVTGSKFSDGYDLIIGTSDKGDDARKVKYPTFTHALIVFGGVEGLEAAIEADSQLQASHPLDLFHFYNNTCLLQQVRTIRTEEAVLISLCVLHDKLCSKGIQ